MGDNLLTPQSGLGAGILHRNSMGVASRGPWSFVGVTWGDAVDGPADGEPMQPHHRPRGGTCEVCGAGIVNIVDAVNRAGEKITVGIDCTQTLWKNQSDRKAMAAFKAALAPHERAKRAAAKARKMARDAAHNLATLGAELAILDALGALPGFGYARGFGLSVARDLRSGARRGMSPAQRGLLAKLAEENGIAGAAEEVR